MNTHDTQVANSPSDRGERVSLLHRMVEAFRRQRRRSRAIRELQRLADWQLLDIGITRADIRTVVDRLLSGEQVRVRTQATVVPMPTAHKRAANDQERQAGLAA